MSVDYFDIPCGSAYPIESAVELTISGCGALVILIVSAATAFRMIKNKRNEEDKLLNVLYYVQLIFFFICALYGPVHPIAAMQICYPSMSMVSRQTAVIMYWSIPMVCLYTDKQIESASCDGLHYHPQQSTHRCTITIGSGSSPSYFSGCISCSEILLSEYSKDFILYRL